MADYTRVIDTDGVTGDYANWEAFDAGFGQDLTAGGPNTCTATCQASTSVADDPGVNIFNNWKL